jgi:hypothetical protein
VPVFNNGVSQPIQVTRHDLIQSLIEKGGQRITLTTKKRSEDRFAYEANWKFNGNQLVQILLG